MSAPQFGPGLPASFETDARDEPPQQTTSALPARSRRAGACALWLIVLALGVLAVVALL